MLFGNRRPRIVVERQRDYPVFQPRAEQLEAKILMAIDLGGTTPTAQPFIASAPYGIDMAATTSSGGAGYSVTDVGDVTGSGYDSFAIGAPTVTSNGITLGSGSGSVYLVLGSTYVTSTGTAVQNWLNTTNGPNLASTDRVGNLDTLGSATQSNPVSNTALTYPFAGVTFTGIPSLGASVSSVHLSTGLNGLLIGAPNASSGVGEAFYITGNFAAYQGMTINLANPAQYTNLKIVTFENTASFGAGGQLGISVAGGSNILGDGAPDIILGAPGATVAATTPASTTNPVTANTGVVYVMSANFLSGATQTIDVSTISSGSQTLTIAGVASGDRAGFSVADAGNVNGASGSVDDLLIGAPQASNSSGAAYLVYGGTSLPGKAIATNGVSFINLNNVVGGSGSGSVPGAIVTGPVGGSETGFSVAAGGDFNADGFADILIGTPLYSASSTVTDAGEVTMLYGAASTAGNYLTGVIPLSTIPTTVSYAQFTGANAGDMAGYAISQVGVINTGQPTAILIGAPGYNSDNGTAYLIPGRANLTGIFSLATEASSPLSGLQFVLTTPGSPAGTANFFGASLSSRVQGTQTNTADLDDEADFIIGAPGYDVTQNSTNPLAGGAMIVESGFLTVPIPEVNTVTTQIGVNTPFSPFSINATTPANLNIYVFGSTTTTPNFMPVTDIDPTTVVVNGVAYPTATLVPDPDTANWLDGIQDAIITINPRSLLNLSNGTDTITISGQTLASSDLPNYTWTGTATVTVTGGSSTPVSTAVGAPATGPVLATTYVSPFGANQYTPSLTALSALNYQPIPLSIAINEYLPTPAFRARLYAYNHPNRKLKVNRGQNTGRASGINTLSSKVFTRSQFHAQKVYNWTHKTAKVGNVSGVLPLQLRKEGFQDNLLH
jgi:hypothetical protein